MIVIVPKPIGHELKGECILVDKSKATRMAIALTRLNGVYVYPPWLHNSGIQTHANL